MVSLLAVDPDDDDAGACNQLVSQIAATIVWRFLVKDDKGWISVMQLLESVNRKILGLIKAEKRRFRKQSEEDKEQKEKETEIEGVSSPNDATDVPPSPNLSPSSPAKS